MSDAQVIMTRFPDDQGGLYLNGRYVASDLKINGRPHFVKQLPTPAPLGLKFGHRRHLFFSAQENAWVVAARCDESEGILAKCCHNGSRTGPQSEK